MTERPWWQEMPVPAFRRRVPELQLPELDLLAGELQGALASIQAQIEAREGTDEWRSRARLALGLLAEKKAAVRAEITRRNQENQASKNTRKAALLDEARAKLDAGDTAGAVALVLDVLQGRHVP